MNDWSTKNLLDLNADFNKLIQIQRLDDQLFEYLASEDKKNYK